MRKKMIMCSELREKMPIALPTAGDLALLLVDFASFMASAIMSLISFSVCL